MNAVEIGEAVSELAEQPFDPEELLVQFVAAFGNKDTTLKRRRTGVSNKLDVSGVPQTKNILIATCALGQTHATLASLRTSAVFACQKARVNRATDGESLEAVGHRHSRFGRRRRQVWAEIRLKAARRGTAAKLRKRALMRCAAFTLPHGWRRAKNQSNFVSTSPRGQLRVANNKRLEIQQEVAQLERLDKS